MSSELVPGLKETTAEAVGSRVRAVRQAMKLSGTKFAAMIGVDQSLLSKIERGQRDLSREVALAVVSQTGCSLDYLYLARRDGLPAGLLARILETSRDD